MFAPTRIVLPELLDELDPCDPRATHSRRDLRRVHRAMGSLSILNAAIARLRLTRRPTRILELGAGDGSLLLRLARAQPEWRGVSLTVLDRQELLSDETQDAFARVGWSLTVMRADVMEWARRDPPQHFDLCITTLFLHHFNSAALGVLLAAIAACTDAFVACEPRRSRVAWLGSKLVWMLGANTVTRGDAVKSVEAGFAHRELTALWPNPHADWRCTEGAAPPFTHCFSAVRKRACHG